MGPVQGAVPHAAGLGYKGQALLPGGHARCGLTDVILGFAGRTEKPGDEPKAARPRAAGWAQPD